MPSTWRASRLGTSRPASLGRAALGAEPCLYGLPSQGASRAATSQGNRCLRSTTSRHACRLHHASGFLVVVATARRFEDARDAQTKPTSANEFKAPLVQQPLQKRRVGRNDSCVFGLRIDVLRSIIIIAEGNNNLLNNNNNDNNNNNINNTWLCPPSSRWDCGSQPGRDYQEAETEPLKLIYYMWAKLEQFGSVVLRIAASHPILDQSHALGYTTVSFHNFKPQNLKSSVSNPKNKYVAYLSVLSQISNCQGLGRKNKFEILKTDRRTLAALGKAPPAFLRRDFLFIYCFIRPFKQITFKV